MLAATPAAAYVGPGAGLSLLGALWGLLAAVAAALGYVILWPFRRMLRRKKQKPQESQAPSEPHAPSTPPGRRDDDGVASSRQNP